ncbi:hypothetical protein SDRG_04136 [Saprolegnia diclina VS20]|uniref:AB hydrolase-1 domain-containing protein n=1 Tax=Saprolegnia diclina (strain VS20) TaxID=1156394 RepID=T0S6P1_SAPDV|nr:hypothetical protein SDRG_04136 [Saprolegnia diclina VS20]EQC38427.1 hypothetical protein SDRG_04136 [Saprolegnia diclina VS20]|eukprot:XP_008608019.1 hypothetical protein SDRG_04136 [Saprolegnia diclina VS20]
MPPSMSRLLALLAPVAAAIDFAATWRDCPTRTSPRAQCADVIVPLCYPGICHSNATLSVHLERIPSTAHSAKSLWFLQGGPGLPSSSLDEAMVRAYDAANGSVSVYTMDHRGTGRSSRLEDACIGVDTLGCFAALKAKYGDDAPSGFSVTSAATDLAALLQGPSLRHDEVYIYGVSYGTYWAQRLMHFSPPNVKGYVLDSVMSASPMKLYSQWDADVAVTETIFYTRCDRDPFCAAKIGPTSQKFAQQLLAKLDANDTACARALPSTSIVRSTLGRLFREPSQRNMIPAVLYHLHKCLDDYPAQARFVQNLLANAVAPLPIDGGSDLLHDAIVYNELWASPTPTLVELQAQAAATTWQPTNNIAQRLVDYCLYTGGSRDGACRDVPSPRMTFAYAHDTYWNVSATLPGSTSVLLLSSDLDAQTLPVYALAANASLASAKTRLLRFPNGGHSVLSTALTPGGSCGAQLLDQFVATSGNVAALDVSCMAAIPALRFDVVYDAEKASELFDSATDMYGPLRVVAAQASDATARAYDDSYLLAGVGAVAGVAMAVGLAALVKLRSHQRTRRRTLVPQDADDLPPTVVAVLRRASMADDLEECKDSDDDNDDNTSDQSRTV